MSFFDEVDEPRRPPRSAPRRTRPSGRGRPPGDQQAIQTRRIVAVVALVAVIVLAGLGIHSCQVSERNSSLKSYDSNVSSLIGRSNTTGANLFKELTSGGGATTLQTELDGTLQGAQSELNDAKGLSVPGQMESAQQNVVLALKMRYDGIGVIARQIQPALGSTAVRDAINQIAGGMARFFGSDVVYKAYAAPEIAAALNAADIGVGGSNGEPINSGQFLPVLGWLEPSFIATSLGAHLPGGGNVNSATPGLHGHSLNSVSADGVTLSPTATNTVPATPAPTLILSLTNGGDFPEFNVGCKVSVSGLSDTGTSTISETTPGQTTTCTVKLPTAPTPGTYNLTAEVEPVPGEKNTANNVLTFPVTFQ